MLVLGIIIVLLILLLILPVGIDGVYQNQAFTLIAKAGPIHMQLGSSKAKEGHKKKKKGEAKAAEKRTPASRQSWIRRGLNRLLKFVSTVFKAIFRFLRRSSSVRLGINDFVEFASIAFKALSRFRRFLSIDYFCLYFIVAAPDPYDAVMQYGYFNAALSLLSPLMHRAFKIRDEEIGLDVDVMGSKPVIQARLVCTIQIWEILVIAVCAGFSVLRWYRAFRKRSKGQNNKEKPTAGAVPAGQKG